MEENNTLKIINNMKKNNIGNTYSLYYSYVKLLTHYSEYTIEELIMLCKVDRLLEMNVITEEVHEYLYSLFEERKHLIDMIEFADQYDLDTTPHKKLDEINKELSKYDVNSSLVDVIDSTIDKNKYESLSPTLSLNKKYKKIIIEGSH